MTRLRGGSRVVSVAGAVAVALAAACGGERADDPAGTPELRAALFDTIIARTERREAFSPLKNASLGYDPVASMRALRQRVVDAATEVDLFYALSAVSAARRDRHLSLLLAPGGLELPDSAGLEVLGGVEGPAPRHAPVRIFPDYGPDHGPDDGTREGADAPAYFVGDLAASDAALPPIGSRLLTINGLPVATWHDAATAYMRHSTAIGLKWKLAEAMGEASALFPPFLQSDSLRLDVIEPDGREAFYVLPYLDAEALAWGGTGSPSYPGTTVALASPTFDLRVPNTAADYVVLVWYGFRETMVPDVDRLVAFADTNGLLDRTLVVDVTRSRGGSLGPYALQRLQPRPFRTTFGNLRLSDVIRPWVEDKRREFAARNVNDGGVPEIIDDGSWLMEWLDQDVMPALERGDAYTNDVPFKSAHAPRDSDGVLTPAPVHFRGNLVVISGPSGGSHLDQFTAIVSDNGLGAVVGMPPGGYSNTWEWEEVLTFPGTDRPVVGFMWNIGHTLRPNGQILEGNPIQVDEWIPLTADNVSTYYELLLERALAHARTGTDR